METEQRLQHIDLTSPFGHSRASFLFSRAKPWRPRDPLYWLSLLHLITSWSGLVPKLHRGSRGPLLLVGGFAYHDFDSNSSDLQLTDFLFSPSYIIVQSPTQSLEWHVWSSSSRNNCHTVQRSLSSGASVYECILGFYLVPFRQPNPPTRFLSITGYWNVSLPSSASLWNGMFGRVEGQYTTVDKFTYLGSSVLSTENDINTRLAKALTAINRLLVIWKSDLTDKIKSFFQAAVVSILLYRFTTWMLTKCMEKKLNNNYTIMLQTILNKSWRQRPTKPLVYGHLPPIIKTIQVRQTRHVWHCWRSNDELISDILLWTLSHGRAKTGQPGRTYIQQFCVDTGCCLEDLLEAMDNRDGSQERVREIHADGATWWWSLFG